jgi:hypothetical protein
MRVHGLAVHTAASQGLSDFEDFAQAIASRAAPSPEWAFGQTALPLTSRFAATEFRDHGRNEQLKLASVRS